MSTAYAPCTCGCQPVVLTGCGCAECQPGPGLHSGALRKTLNPDWNRKYMVRMMFLLRSQDLTQAESDELDGLLNDYVGRR